MAIGVYFTFTGLNAANYAECLKRLRAAGAAHPPGRSFHTSFGSPEKLMVFDVWSSQPAFEKFGKTLMPILDSLGVKPSPPELMPINKVIMPPRAPAKRMATPVRKK
jgi:hypothetical protein